MLLAAAPQYHDLRYLSDGLFIEKFVEIINRADLSAGKGYDDIAGLQFGMVGRSVGLNMLHEYARSACQG